MEATPVSRLIHQNARDRIESVGEQFLTGTVLPFNREGCIFFPTFMTAHRIHTGKQTENRALHEFLLAVFLISLFCGSSHSIQQSLEQATQQLVQQQDYVSPGYTGKTEKTSREPLTLAFVFSPCTVKGTTLVHLSSRIVDAISASTLSSHLVYTEITSSRL